MLAEIPPLQRRYLTTKEVAEELRVTDYTVRKWIKEGALNALRVGQEWRITPADLEAFIEKLREQSKKSQ